MLRRVLRGGRSGLIGRPDETRRSTMRPRAGAHCPCPPTTNPQPAANLNHRLQRLASNPPINPQPTDNRNHRLQRLASNPPIKTTAALRDSSSGRPASARVPGAITHSVTTLTVKMGSPPTPPPAIMRTRRPSALLRPAGPPPRAPPRKGQGAFTAPIFKSARPHPGPRKLTERIGHLFRA